MRKVTKIALALLLVLATASFVVGAGDDGRDVVLMNRVTGGSLSVTNEMGLNSVWELKRVEFAIPTAVLTNAFQVAVTRTYDLPQGLVNEVETNTVISASGIVETNVLRYAGGSVTYTNTHTFTSTTNDTSVQVYDEDDFGQYFAVQYRDVQAFTFTETNAVNLLRVYRARMR